MKIEGALWAKRLGAPYVGGCRRVCRPWSVMS